MEVNNFRVFLLFQKQFVEQFGEISVHLENSNIIEDNIASQLFDLFLDLCSSTVNIVTDETLDVIDECEETMREVEELNMPSTSEPLFPFSKIPLHDEEMCYNFDFEYDDSDISKKFTSKQMENVVKLKDEKKLSFSWIQKICPWVKYATYISRFRNYINARGTFYMKINEIENFIFEQFKDARSRFLPVHDRDLRSWALVKAREFGMNTFKGSSHFLLNLKSRLRISSRRVTSIITKRHIETEEQKNEAKQFHLSTVNEKIKDYNFDNILNSDQSGFNYEYTSTRTLSNTGERKTLQVANSISNTTHSYSIQPTITASGKLLSPMLICLQEVTGNEFGPRVAATLHDVPNNLFVVCSKSGKLTKSHVSDWATYCLLPHLTDSTMLLMDSWTAQSEVTIKKDLTEEVQEKLHVFSIPPGTTGGCQPLDVYFFRHYKIFVRTIYDVASLHGNRTYSDRLAILNIHSLIHNQLSSEAFQPMLRYAWFKSGYDVPEPGRFKNVKEICFDNLSRTFCEECGEEDITYVFMKCAHCQKHLCLKHFLDRKCWHV